MISFTKKTNTISIVLCLLFSISYAVKGQHFLKTQGKEIVNENQEPVLLRGMGLGGWMLQEGYMLQTAGFANAQYEIRNKIEELIGPSSTDEFYEAWLANHCTKADIDSLKSWGFNSVRLPMHYNLFTLAIEQEPIPGQDTWLDKGFEMTDDLISWCAENEMYVILDLHAAPGGQGMDAAISDYDPSKPSLWESERNREKTVALWRRLAERYADEQWVAGYDLINEINWNLPGNVAIRELYGNITNAIREVDNKHIIFIEGNWFANDFTGLTPPWDDNMVYSPHKYWSYNDQGSIQWVLDMREQYDIPLYLGESGENSNVWFRDAIHLLEDNNIGWAWWPMKKIESVAGPLSVTKTTGYQNLLNYWSGTGATPSAAAAKATLMEITELLKIGNCKYQKDVVDAMFRQVYSDETVPYKTQNIPGLVIASNYDMGVVGEAYYDTDLANYSVSSGNYSAWNNGWAHRNDGVDLEFCSDNVNTNGYNVGFVEKGEWMQYTVDVATTAVYDVNVRVASGSTGGNFHLAMDGADISIPYYVPNTGGWQSWETLVIPDVIINESDQKLRLVIDGSGFNLNSLEFVEKGATTSIPAEFVTASTFDEETIQLNINKYLASPLPSLPGGFSIFVDGNSVPITGYEIDSNNPRIVYFTVDFSLNPTNIITISYNGNQISAADGTEVNNFNMEPVQNKLSGIKIIPGKIEAEDFTVQVGVQLETTSDNGGGQNIGFLDPGDYLDYEVFVTDAGTYQVDFRVASETSNGAIELQLIENEEIISTTSIPNFAITGGWQSWVTATNNTIQLPQGRYTLRMLITAAPFNMNWMEFSFLTSTNTPTAFNSLEVFPNPSDQFFNVVASLDAAQDVELALVNRNGQISYSKIIKNTSAIQTAIPISNLPSGVYMLRIRLEDGTFHTERVVKMK